MPRLPIYNTSLAFFSSPSWLYRVHYTATGMSWGRAIEFSNGGVCHGAPSSSSDSLPVCSRPICPQYLMLHFHLPLDCCWVFLIMFWWVWEGPICGEQFWLHGHLVSLGQTFYRSQGQVICQQLLFKTYIISWSWPWYRITVANLILSPGFAISSPWAPFPSNIGSYVSYGPNHRLLVL